MVKPVKKPLERVVFELSKKAKTALLAESRKTGCSMSYILRSLVDDWEARRRKERSA